MWRSLWSFVLVLAGITFTAVVAIAATGHWTISCAPQALTGLDCVLHGGDHVRFSAAVAPARWIEPGVLAAVGAGALLLTILAAIARAASRPPGLPRYRTAPPAV